MNDYYKQMGEFAKVIADEYELSETGRVYLRSAFYRLINMNIKPDAIKLTVAEILYGLKLKKV